VPVSTVIGGAIGGTTGAGALVALVGSTPAGAMLGGASSAVIGALAGFLIASFVQIMRTSLREAIAAEARAAAEARS
jgi:mannitol-specific phosphotransferase system IIBC component